MPSSGTEFNRQRQRVEVVLPTLAEVLQVKKCLKEDYKKLKKFMNVSNSASFPRNDANLLSRPTAEGEDESKYATA